MAWTDPRTWAAGEIVTAAMMNTHVRDNLNAVAPGGGGWTDFVPVLETSGTQPNLGSSGNIAEARWIQFLGLVFVQGQFKYGTVGVTVGTGNYYVKFGGGLTDGPPDAQTTMGHVAGNGLIVGQAFGNDTDAGKGYPYHLLIDTAVRVSVARLSGGTAENTPVSVSNPYAVAVNDRIRFTFWYGAA